MKEEKTTLIKPGKLKEKEKKKLDYLNPLIMFIIGFILLVSSDKFIIVICYFLGLIAIIIGIVNLIKYYKMKKESDYCDNSALVLGGSATFLGLLIILLASAIEIGIRYIIGFTFLFNGYKKLTTGLATKNYITLSESIIFILLGLYTILAQNIVFNLIGLLLLISSLIDLFEYYKQKK